MSIKFSTQAERYEVSDWGIYRNGEKIQSISDLTYGDIINFRVAFLNLKIDKECVLIIRTFEKGVQNGLLAQEVTIFPDVIPFDLMSEGFSFPNGTDSIDLSLQKDFETITVEEENKFLIGKHIHGLTATKLNPEVCGFEKIEEVPSENPSLYIGDYSPCKELFHGTVCFVQDSCCLWIKDAKYRAEKKVIRKDDKLWIPSETINNLFGINFENDYAELSEVAKQLDAYSYIDRFGLGVISDLPYDYSETKYQKEVQFMVRYIEYSRPKAAQLKQMFKKRVRPSCLGFKEEVEKALNLAKSDKRAKWLSGKLISYADMIMERPVQYKLDKPREQSGFITAIVDYDDIMALYWAYLATEDRKYLERMKEHTLAMAGLEHWCGDHFALMMSRALISVGMAFDFLYDEFTKEERDFLAKAMIEKGFLPSLELYYGRGDEAAWPWVIRRTNWNYIPNSGLIFAACVLMGEYKTDLCADVLEKALQSLEYPAIYLAPDGELFEGLAYAAYSLNYLVFAFCALNNCFGTAFGFDETAGIQHSHKIPYSLMSKCGVYSSGDSGSELNLNTGYTMWFAKKYQDHSVQCMRHMQIAEPGGNKPVFTDMLWFDENGYEVAQFANDVFYESTQSAISRSDWGDKASLLFLHGGDNTMEHGHYDLGNFEFEMNGFRFAHEMGMDDEIYCAPGSGYMLQEFTDYYVARAEGHNVYVINPDRSPGQRSIGKAKIETLELSENAARYRMNLESAYRGQVKDAVRYCELIENRKVFVVQDEIVPMKSGDDIYWHWHTFAKISFSDPRAVEIKDNYAILTAPNGSKLHLQFDANIDFVLRKGMSLPKETSPAPFDQLQGNIISNMITVYFKTGNEPILFRVTAWEEGKNYIPEALNSKNES